MLPKIILKIIRNEIMPYNFPVPVRKRLLKKKKIYLDFWASQFSYLMQAFWGDTSAKLWASYTQNGVAFRYFIDGRLIHTLFVFSNPWFSYFKECYSFIFDIFCLTDVEGNLSVSTNAICQTLEITLAGSVFRIALDQ